LGTFLSYQHKNFRNVGHIPAKSNGAAGLGVSTQTQARLDAVSRGARPCNLIQLKKELLRWTACDGNETLQIQRLQLGRLWLV
jgi:hypothetical protein